MELRRPWTTAEDEVIRAMYADNTAAAIAERLGRTVSMVYKRAKVIGIRKCQPVDPALIEQIPALHALGLSDRQIADRLGINRRWTSDLRAKRFKLPVNAEAVAEAHRQALRSQLKTLGLSSPTQLRTRAYERFAVESGWPADMRPREVQILNALAAHGPLTALQIAKAIGTRTDLKNSRTGYSKLLAGCNRISPTGSAYGTYTASLLGLGLIVCAKRYRAGGKRDFGRLPSLYMLSPLAISIIESRTKPCQQTEPTTAAAPSGSPTPDR